MNGLDIMKKHSAYSEDYIRNIAIECQWEEMYIRDCGNGQTIFIEHYSNIMGSGYMKYDKLDGRHITYYQPLSMEEFEEMKRSSGFIQVLPPEK